MQFDLPGVASDAIELTVERNVLTVHAQRQRSDSDDVELLIGERPYGTFSASFSSAKPSTASGCRPSTSMAC